VRELVRGYADAIFEDRSDLNALGAELTSFAEALAGSEDLRGALTDPTISAPTRTAIVHDLLSRRVSPKALGLCAFAVQGGPAGEYADDVGSLATSARALRDGMVLRYDGPLGRVAATDRLDGYATAVLAPVRGEAALDNIEDELFRFMRTVEGNEALLEALTSPEISAEVRRAMVLELLASRATSESARTAAYAAHVGRPRDYIKLLEALVQRVALEAHRRVADVRAAVVLAEPERLRLAAALGRLVGYQVEVRVTAEPHLLGGFVATVGDTVVDCSLRHRLEQAKELFAMSPGAPGAGSSPGTERTAD
jgi:F-type H+-transporting ATPase subunit delta